MTPAQAALLKACIEADRLYRSRLAAGEYMSNDERGVEISAVFNANPRTARVLADLGLIELVDLGYANARAFLGRYQSVDDVSDVPIWEPDLAP